MFYELTHPAYETDYRYEDENPVRLVGEYWIPAINCEECLTWACTNERIWNVSESSRESDFLRPSPLERRVWMTMVSGWSRILGVEARRIRPGTYLGPPVVELSGVKFGDIVHPYVGPKLVRNSVREYLVANKFSGVRFHSVQILWGKGDEGDAFDNELWAMEITGKKWRAGENEDSVVVCDLCKRTKFLQDVPMRIDESRSDDSEFFILDDNPNMLFVSESCGQKLLGLGLTNTHLRPVSP